MATIEEIRERAAAHARHLDAVTFTTVQDLAGRWGVAETTVLAVPRAQLPFLTFGKSRMRRYDPRDVEAFEEAMKRGEYELVAPEGVGPEARAS